MTLLYTFTHKANITLVMCNWNVFAWWMYCFDFRGINNYYMSSSGKSKKISPLGDMDDSVHYTGLGIAASCNSSSDHPQHLVTIHMTIAHKGLKQLYNVPESSGSPQAYLPPNSLLKIYFRYLFYSRMFQEEAVGWPRMGLGR